MSSDSLAHLGHLSDRYTMSNQTQERSRLKESHAERMDRERKERIERARIASIEKAKAREEAEWQERWGWKEEGRKALEV